MKDELGCGSGQGEWGSPTSHGEQSPREMGENHSEFGMTSGDAFLVEWQKVGGGPARSRRPVLVCCAEDWNSLLSDER